MASETDAPMAREDAIRVVPVHTQDELAHPRGAAPPPPAARLTYRNGPLLESVQVFTAFWGPDWATGDLATLAGQLNTFFDTILVGALMDQLTEYDVPGHGIGKGTRIGTATITSPTLRQSASDTAVQKMLQARIADGTLPAATPNTLYFVYLPPGVVSVQGGSRSCTQFCGYHSDVSGQIFYAVMPYPGCAGCVGSLDVLAAVTSTSSHELCEAITDAVPGSGWYDDVNGEIGDICAWQTKELDGYTVQLEWSNAANACR
jgi:hypothetical protein